MNGIKKYFESDLGWADIECLLSYENFTLNDLENVVNYALTIGLNLEEGIQSPTPDKSSFSAFSISDPNQSIQPPAGMSLSKFIESISTIRCNVINVNMKSILHDVETEIVFSFFMQRKVIVIYCIENFLWGYGDNVKLSDVRRLQAFYKICKSICDLLPPIYAYVGPEEIHAMDIQVENAEKNHFTPYDPEIFSDKNAQDLVNWYLAHKDFTAYL